jgi:hypothetical protein
VSDHEVADLNKKTAAYHNLAKAVGVYRNQLVQLEQQQQQQDETDWVDVQLDLDQGTIAHTTKMAKLAGVTVDQFIRVLLALEVTKQVPSPQDARTRSRELRRTTALHHIQEALETSGIAVDQRTLTCSDRTSYEATVIRFNSDIPDVILYRVRKKIEAAGYMVDLVGRHITSGLRVAHL